MPQASFFLRIRSTLKALQEDQGQMLVVVILSMGLILSFMALAFDVGQFLYVKRQLQTAADAAALAGALEIPECTSSNCKTMQTAASDALAEDGYANAALVTQCGTPSSAGLVLELNNGPCALGANDPNYKNTQYVEALVILQQPPFLARLMGMNSVDIAARAEAGMSAPTCVYITDPSGAQALTVNNGGSLTSACGIDINSSSPNALSVGSTSTTLTAASGGIDIHGGAGLDHGSPNPAPTTDVPTVSDPLASLQNEAPSTTPCGISTASPYSGANGNVTVSSTATFNPGVYCGGINFNGSARGTFNAGTYVFSGPLNVGTGSISSNGGVTFYFSSGSLTMNTGGHANLVAPTSGTYAGILLFQNVSDTNQVILNDDSTSAWQGAIYLPGASLTINGAGNGAAYTILDVEDLTVDGSFSIGDNYSSLPGGPPIPTSATLTE